MQSQRIGVLTSGGDCPGLKAVLRGVSYQNYEILDAPIAQAVHRLRLVTPDHQLVQTAREMESASAMSAPWSKPPAEDRMLIGPEQLIGNRIEFFQVL